MAESIIQAITDYLMDCPLLSDGVFRVDALSEKSIEYTIETAVFNPILKTYVNGDTERQYQFDFASREAFSMDRIQNIQNTAFYEQFAEWIEEQDRAGNYPELPEKCTPLSLELLSPGYIFTADMRSARYKIQLRLTYYKEV